MRLIRAAIADAREDLSPFHIRERGTLRTLRPMRDLPLARTQSAELHATERCDLKTPPIASEVLCAQLSCVPWLSLPWALLLLFDPPPSPACRLVVIDPIVCCALVRLASRVFRVLPP
eukprot:4640200-Prymnesium_polylepis.1